MLRLRFWVRQLLPVNEEGAVAECKILQQPRAVRNEKSLVPCETVRGFGVPEGTAVRMLKARIAKGNVISVKKSCPAYL